MLNDVPGRLGGAQGPAFTGRGHVLVQAGTCVHLLHGGSSPRYSDRTNSMDPVSPSPQARVCSPGERVQSSPQPAPDIL